MAIISKIRDKSGLIVFIVGLGLLLFIIPFDQIGQKFSGTGEQPIAEMNGKSVYDTDWKFYENVQQETDYYRTNSPGYTFTEKDLLEIEANVWRRVMSDTLLKLEYANLGLRVGKKELNDVLIYGENPSPEIKNNDLFNIDLGNGQKMFIRDSVVAKFTRWQNEMATYKGNERAYVEAQMYYGWTLPITNTRLKEKYTAMMKYGVMGTTLEAQRKHKEENTTAEVSFLYLNYFSIDDSIVKVTDKDLKAYYDKHLYDARYKNEGDVRGFKYVIFDIAPSEKDVETLSSTMNNLKDAFKTAVNDTAFLIANAASAQTSSNPMDVLPADAFVAGSNLFSLDIENAILSAKKGDVIGPFSHSNNSKMLLVKVISSETKAETEIRQIFIPKQFLDDTQIAARKKTADSLVTVLNNDKSKFAELSLQFHKDYENPTGISRVNADEDVQWGTDFKNHALNGTVGSVKMIASETGFHVIEILERGDFTYNRIAIVDKDLTPSKMTRQSEIESKALPFITALQNGKSSFDKVAQEFGTMPNELSRIYLMNPTYSMTEIGFSMDILGWAFNRGVGSVSEPIILEGNKIFIGQVTYAAAEGTPDFESAKEDMREEVIKEKKAEYAINRIKNAKSIDDAVANLPGATIQTRTVRLSDNYLVAGQNDPKAVAYAFTTVEGATSKPIQGDRGVYMIAVKSKSGSAPAEDVTVQREQITQTHRTNVEQGYLMALYRAADVKDWRIKRKISNY
jgi:parvulin-like peptidyl-prolyl isomerase